MASRRHISAWFVVILIALAGGGYLFYLLEENPDRQTAGEKEKNPVPVQVANVHHGPISLRRTFSGSIEPRTKFTVAPKISGRIQVLHADVSDQVRRGQLLVELEDAEYKQEVIEAQANLAVAEANHVEAVSRLEIAQRELQRTKTLFNRGVASESAFDSAKATFLTSQSAVKVAAANLEREQAMLRAAGIRLGYTQVKAEWQQGDNQRTVAERFVDEGNTVAANTPLLSIIELNPVIAVIQVIEKDYPLITLGQKAKVYTDAYPERVFAGVVSRISPIFRESSRQARMELEVANPDHLLKPGMFSRCTLELQKIDDAISVPDTAITSRNDQRGVFKVDNDGTSVEWVPVEPGFTSGDRVRLIAPELSGRVVTLGQQLIKDGSAVRITEEISTTAEGGKTP